jgi:hypothetical protein
VFLSRHIEPDRPLKLDLGFDPAKCFTERFRPFAAGVTEAKFYCFVDVAESFNFFIYRADLRAGQLSHSFV